MKKIKKNLLLIILKNHSANNINIYSMLLNKLIMKESKINNIIKLKDTDMNKIYYFTQINKLKILIESNK